jgi:hypothetical protein
VGPDGPIEVEEDLRRDLEQFMVGKRNDG